MIIVGILGASGDAVLEIARRSAAAGARTEVVGAAPSSPDGDRLLLQLATAGVGHATVTRSALGVEPADLDLALRYLPDIRVVVLVRPAVPLLATAVAAASFAGAALVIVGPLDAAAIETLGTSPPIVLEPPARDPDGAFAGLVAALSVRLEAGEDSTSAWAAATAELAIERVSRSTD